MQLAVFKLDNEEYGIEISAVNSILSSKKFPIGNMVGKDDSIEGIINLRGKINFILNLRKKFKMPLKEIDDESKFLMLNIEDSNIGCLVDDVIDIVKLQDSEIENPPSFLYSNKYVLGIGKIEDRIIIILDPPFLLSNNQIVTAVN